MRVILITCVAALVIATITDGSESRIKRSINEKSFEEELKEGNQLLNNERNADATMELLKKLHSMKEEMQNELPAAEEPSADEEKVMEDYTHMEKGHIEQEPMGDTIEEINRNSKVATALFQGDMLLSKEQADEIIEDIRENAGQRRKRQAFRDKNYPRTLWSNGVNYFFYNATSHAIRVLRKAIQLWTENTCIDFHENPSAEDRIFVIDGSGCWSHVGRLGGWQTLSLGDGCWTIGLAAHELGHSLGLYHTQSRHDRDDFITLHFENLRDGWEDQFVKQTEATNYNYNLTYDYGTVMHYSATGVSKNGRPYMVPRDNKFLQTLGSQFISFYEKLMINLHYGCLKKCEADSSSAKCENGGFPNPRDCSRCICPSGYGGRLCNERPAGCGQTLKATKEYQTLEDKVGKDNYVQGGINDDFETCNYWIEGPPGSTIEVVFDSYPEDMNYPGCKWGGVEIKTLADKRHTGYRFCSPTYFGTSLVSTHNIVPIITTSRAYKVPAKLRYRIASLAPETSETTTQPKKTKAPKPEKKECKGKERRLCKELKKLGFCKSNAYTREFKDKLCPGICLK